jgi:hypothetical protein
VAKGVYRAWLLPRIQLNRLNSPNIIFNDADLEQAVKWAAFGILYATNFLIYLEVTQLSDSITVNAVALVLGFMCNLESTTSLPKLSLTTSRLFKSVTLSMRVFTRVLKSPKRSKTAS